MRYTSEAMGLYLNQNQTRSQLSSKVAADLAQRISKRSIDDGSKTTVLLQNQRKTTSGGLFWSIIVALLVLAVVTYLILF